MSIYTDAQEIIHSALEACLPDQAVRRALEGKEFGSGRIFLVALGKAAWQMAHCAAELLGPRLERGVVVTKHGHSQGTSPAARSLKGDIQCPTRAPSGGPGPPWSWSRISPPRTPWSCWSPAAAPPCLRAP